MSDNEELRRLVHKSRERLRPENIATALTSGEYIFQLGEGVLQLLDQLAAEKERSCLLEQYDLELTALRRQLAAAEQREAENRKIKNEWRAEHTALTTENQKLKEALAKIEKIPSYVGAHESLTEEECLKNIESISRAALAKKEPS